MTVKGPAGVTTSIRCCFAASCARMGLQAAASKSRHRGVSFDHFVGSREQCGRNSKAERLGSGAISAREGCDHIPLFRKRGTSPATPDGQVSYKRKGGDHDAL
jgi:hypothetical protein